MIRSRVSLWIAAIVLSSTLALLAQQSTAHTTRSAVPTLVNFSSKLTDVSGFSVGHFGHFQKFPRFRPCVT